MWNPFRRKPAGADFPKAKWPPIQNLDAIDLTGKRRDGGVDLMIVASQPLDDSPATLDSLRQKVETYLATVVEEAFLEEFGRPPLDKIRIVIFCEHPVHPTAAAVIDECAVLARNRGVRLEFRKSLG